MNLIMIVADTFRADHLGCYGNERVKTPNLDRLASEGVRFTNAYADGLATIPMRRVFYTGKSILPECAWIPMAKEDVTLAEILSENGFTTALVSDCYHQFKPGMNFHRGFNSWEWIRGQENDLWRSGPKEKFDPKEVMPEHLWNDLYDVLMRQYLMNQQDRRTEEDYICARSCRAAMRWLEQNMADKPFMLWIELFDPHEPWDAPERFRKMYCDDYPCENFQFGYGVREADIRDEDIPAIQALYAAEVTFVDLWLGRLFERVRDLGLMDDTIIAFSTDHGTHLGEGGHVQKKSQLLNSCYARLPLIVRHPDQQVAGQSVDALVSGIDYAPTFLQMLGVEEHSPMDGANFWSLATGEAESIHDRVFTGSGGFGMVRDPEWHYFQQMKADGPPGHGPCLYDLKNDPKETTNVVQEHPDVAAELRKLLEDRFGVSA